MKINFFALLLLLFCSCWSAADEPVQEKRARVELEVDAYYASIGLYSSLTKKPIPYVGEKSEWEIYKDLIKRFYLPRTAVLEASINPLPYAGTLIKKQAADFYHSMNVNNSLNLVQAVTTGFEEPWAVALFLGDVVEFKSAKKTYTGKRHGYIGYLLSAGNFHIKDSELIIDNWLEAEWKIKGEQFLKERILKWSFRVGGKLHNNPYIQNTLYVSFRRSRTDFGSSRLFFLNNSGFEYTFDFSQKNADAIRHYFLVDKKIPLTKPKIALTLAVGFVWTSPDKYSGPLAIQTEERDPFQIFIRPNVEF